MGAGKERKPKRTLRSNLALTITDYTLTVIWGYFLWGKVVCRKKLYEASFTCQVSEKDPSLNIRQQNT